MEPRIGHWRRLQAAFPAEWARNGALSSRTLVAAYVGSTAHGTYIPSSDPHHIDDVDLMAIVQPPREYVYGLRNWEHYCPEMGSHDELDIVSYSIRKFAGLLLKGNPNVLGLLWTPERHLITQSRLLWPEWIDRRKAFLSQRVYSSFVGYATSQLMRLGKPDYRGYMGKDRKELFAKYGYDIKNGAHCLRLLRMGLELLQTGELHVDRSEIDADELKQIKTGQWSLERIQGEAEAGLESMRDARDAGRLPAEPDLSVVEPLVMRSMETLWGSNAKAA